MNSTRSPFFLVVDVLDYLFGGAPAYECDDACDVNDDGLLDIADGIYLLNYLFASGPPPAAPDGSCGPDLTADGLGCDQFAACD